MVWRATPKRSPATGGLAAKSRRKFGRKTAARGLLFFRCINEAQRLNGSAPLRRQAAWPHRAAPPASLSSDLRDASVFKSVSIAPTRSMKPA